MVGFSRISVICQIEDQKMMKDKLIDGKKMWVDLEVNQRK